MHEGHRERMREKLLNTGLDGFHDHEVLEYLLFHSIPQKNTNDIAHSLMDKYGSLNDVLNQSYDELLDNKGVGKASALLLSVIPMLARRYFKDSMGKRPQLNTVELSGQYVRALLWGLTHEHFYMICLDNRCRVLRDVLVSAGTVSEASIYPRTVVENSLRYKASFVLLAHNHPSGGAQPSRQDIEATQAVLQALRPVGIDLIDHLIVAGDKLYSFARKGLITMDDEDGGDARYAAENGEVPSAEEPPDVEF